MTEPASVVTRPRLCIPSPVMPGLRTLSGATEAGNR